MLEARQPPASIALPHILEAKENFTARSECLVDTIHYVWLQVDVVFCLVFVKPSLCNVILLERREVVASAFSMCGQHC